MSLFADKKNYLDTNLHQQSLRKPYCCFKSIWRTKLRVDYLKKQRLLKERWHMLSAINFNNVTLWNLI